MLVCTVCIQCTTRWRYTKINNLMETVTSTQCYYQQKLNKYCKLFANDYQSNYNYRCIMYVL